MELKFSEQKPCFIYCFFQKIRPPPLPRFNYFMPLQYLIHGIVSDKKIIHLPAVSKICRNIQMINRKFITLSLREFKNNFVWFIILL